MRVAIYTRLSKDAQGTQTATARQEQACRAFASIRGWPVAGVYEDVDRSAYQPQVKRPQFEQLLADAEARRFEGILAWKLDRLVRRPFQFERLWSVADRSGVFVASATEPIDTSSEIGVALLRILVAVASYESATTGFRVAAKKREIAERGTPPPVRAFGWNDDWSEVVESEAALLREAAHRVLEGERAAAIARDWRVRGLIAPGGGHWTDASLSRMLKSPRIQGDRTYKGEVVARDCWPAILDRDVAERVRLTLTHPGRRGSPGRHQPRLATGIATCGRCGQRMGTTTRSGIRYYSCPTAPTGCGRTHVKAEALEALLLGALGKRLKSTGFVPARFQEKPDDIAERLQALARDYYAEALLSRDEFLSARDALVRQADAILNVDNGRDEELRVLLGGRLTPTRALKALDAAGQRRVAQLLVERLRVNPAPRETKGRFDARRVDIEWTEPES